MKTNTILCGDALLVLRSLPDASVHMCVTSPPYYGLRDYGVSGQIGLEETPAAYVAKLTAVFHELRRVLRPDGVLFLNIADSYAGSGKGGDSTSIGRRYSYSPDNPVLQMPSSWQGIKPKDMMGIPWMLAFALRHDGWYLRSDIIWQKTNAMPHPVKDRPVSSYEHIFLFANSKKYYFSYKALEEPMAESSKQRYSRKFGSPKYADGVPGQTAQTINQHREKNALQPEMRRGRDIWSFSTAPHGGSSHHYATFPLELAKRCILAGCPEGGIVIDPFFGSGTTGVAALMHNRQYIGIELNPDYMPLAEERLKSYMEAIACTNSN